MRARKTRAVPKVAIERSAGATPPEKGKRERSHQTPTSQKPVTGVAPRRAPGVSYSSERSGAPVPRRSETTTWSEAPLSAVISHILDQHHKFTYRQLDRLERLLAQVVDQHARDHPQLVELQVLFLVLSDKLTSHMIREEQMLFPYILRLEEAAEHGERLARPVFGSVRDPIDVLMVEHEGIKAALEKIRVSGGSYVVPPEGSASWKALARGLNAFEQDLYRHVQIEDTVLFPRAVSVEGCDRYLVEV
jgi:regulator of cell morphogenesis and NO signaling